MPGFKISGSETDSSNAFHAPVNPQGDFLRANRWTIVRMFNTAGNNESKNIFYAKSVDLPERTVEIEDITTPGGTYKFAKSVKYGDLKITFYGTSNLVEFLNGIITGAGNISGVHNKSKGILDFNKYFNTIDIVQHRGDITEGHDVKYKFFNCVPINISHEQLTYTSSEVYSITITFALSHYTRGVNGESPDKDSGE
jgi:hypothetical protein